MPPSCCSICWTWFTLDRFFFKAWISAKSFFSSWQQKRRRASHMQPAHLKRVPVEIQFLFWKQRDDTPSFSGTSASYLFSQDLRTCRNLDVELLQEPIAASKWKTCCETHIKTSFLKKWCLYNFWNSVDSVALGSTFSWNNSKRFRLEWHRLRAELELNAGDAVVDLLLGIVANGLPGAQWTDWNAHGKACVKLPSIFQLEYINLSYWI